jgi:heme-degrading monooxygenase HmoA
VPTPIAARTLAREASSQFDFKTGECVIVSVVRFRSLLSDADVQAIFEQRAKRYRQVPGLVQKIYVRFRESGEFGAVYLWDSEEALQRFAETDLARTIPNEYRAESAPSAELADVRLLV